MKRYLAIIFAALFFLASVDALARPILTAQKVVYRGTVTGLRVSAVDGTAFIDGANASITALADGNHSLEIYDTAGRFVRGVLKAVGTSETLDATNLVTEWANVNYDTFTSVSSPNITSAIYSTSGTQTAMTYAFTLVAGKLYKLVAVWTNVAAGEAPSLQGGAGFPTTTLAAGTNTIYFTATGTGGYLAIVNWAAASWSCTFVLKQVTVGSTSGSTIVTAKAGTVFNFGYKNAAFTYNAASYFCVVRRLR